MKNFTIPGIDEGDAKKIVDLLQERLSDYNDLHLILKHAHWNVHGPNFIAVHEMIDPQVEEVRGFADEVAERIAALGGTPIGTPDGHSSSRTPLQYDVNAAGTEEHLQALNTLYTEVISKVRESIAEVDDLDLVTQDMLIGEAGALEKFQWFVREHIVDQNSNL